MLQQLLASCFAIIYSWQLSSRKKSLVGGKNYLSLPVWTYINEVMNNLETTTEKMFEWFSFNNLKANASKCHLFLSPYQPVPVNIKGSINENSNCEKLLGIYIDTNFSFEYHINRICKKLHALSGIAKYISEEKKLMLFNLS